MRIDIPDEQWNAIGSEGDEWARVLLADGLTINGTGFHLEGWAVSEIEGDQVADEGDEALGYVGLGVGQDSRFETVTIYGREYVLVASPHC